MQTHRVGRAQNDSRWGLVVSNYYNYGRERRNENPPTSRKCIINAIRGKAEIYCVRAEDGDEEGKMDRVRKKKGCQISDPFIRNGTGSR